MFWGNNGFNRFLFYDEGVDVWKRHNSEARPRYFFKMSGADNALVVTELP